MNRRLVTAAQFATVGALLAVGIAAKTEASGPCQTIFKAHVGVVDSCTGEPASPYRDLPTRTPTPTPQPAPIVIVVPAPVVNVKVTVKTQAPVATPTPSCGYWVNVLGRCPVPGDSFYVDSQTGQLVTP